MNEILYHFLSHLGWGMLATLPLVPPTRIGRTYYVVNSLCVMGLWITALALGSGGDLGQLNMWGAGATAALMLSFMIDPSISPRPALVFIGVALVLGAVGLYFDAVELVGDEFYTSLPFLLATAFSSSLLAGGTLVAMILGHFYLVTPGLSFGYLNRFVWVIGALLGVRLVLALVTVFAADLFKAPEGADKSLFFIDHLAFLLQRGLTIVALAVLLPMIVDCVRRGANQSATGLLYVASFLALMGEGVATYFVVAYQLPL